MRELKFRAWDKLAKKWDTTLKLKLNGNLEDIDFDSDGAYRFEPEPDKYIIEQYTGLKDKNGKEIYEGDIVRVESCGRIDFKAGAIEMGRQMYLIMNTAHYTDPDLTHTEPLGQYFDTELEVIGNIHENPELIGGKE